MSDRLFPLATTGTIAGHRITRTLGVSLGSGPDALTELIADARQRGRGVPHHERPGLPLDGRRNDERWGIAVVYGTAVGIEPDAG